MSLDLVGITIENKYYSQHYLSAIFEGDLKDTFSQWQVMDDNYREAVTADQPRKIVSSTKNTKSTKIFKEITSIRGSPIG